jgi:SAM-dependent methyltransferase
MNDCVTHLTALLDHVYRRFARGDVAAAMAVLCEELRVACLEAPREEWRHETAPACRRHPLHTLLLQDPYTRRAFEKPRGYAGDAVMLDYVYTGVAPPGTTDLGREVFRATAGSPNGRSVVARRDRLAELIDEAVEAAREPAILSLGCGHLREAQRARSARAGWGGRFHSLDQDAESLAVVQREQGRNGVRTVHSSVVPIVRGRSQIEGQDLVYAAGLLDYLSDALAAGLLRAMYAMLRPGGRLLVANFTPDSRGRGYMEAVMDWWLVYRDEAQMEDLAGAVPNAAEARSSVLRDAEGNVVYLELTRTA